PLRSVSVTSAFEPSPPLRQDCEEIFKPSIGGLSGTDVSADGAVTAGAVASMGAVACAGLTKVVSVGATASSSDSFWAKMTGDGVAADWPSASLGPGSAIHAAHPAIAMAGSTRSRTRELPKDHPVILMAVTSTGGECNCPAAREKSPAGVSPYGVCHDCRCTVSAASASITESGNGFTQARQYCGG